MSAQKIFISYRQESDALSAQVLALAERLIQSNITVELDRLYFRAHPGGPPEGWPKWCENQVTLAHKTLIVASPGWFAAYEGKASAGTGLGAAYEAGLVQQMLYNAQGRNDQFRLVFLAPMAASAVPVGLQRWHQYMLYKGDSEFSDLLAWLSDSATAPTTAGAPSTPSLLITGLPPATPKPPLLPRDLLEFLAENYPDVRDARALWQRAGGRAAEVENISRPFDLWQALWRRSVQGAAAQPKVLLREVLQDYPGNAVVAHYLSSL